MALIGPESYSPKVEEALQLHLEHERLKKEVEIAEGELMLLRDVDNQVEAAERRLASDLQLEGELQRLVEKARLRLALSEEARDRLAREVSEELRWLRQDDEQTGAKMAPIREDKMQRRKILETIRIRVQEEESRLQLLAAQSVEVAAAATEQRGRVNRLAAQRIHNDE